MSRVRGSSSATSRARHLASFGSMRRPQRVMAASATTDSTRCHLWRSLPGTRDSMPSRRTQLAICIGRLLRLGVVLLGAVGAQDVERVLVGAFGLDDAALADEELLLLGPVVVCEGELLEHGLAGGVRLVDAHSPLPSRFVPNRSSHKVGTIARPNKIGRAS